MIRSKKILTGLLTAALILGSHSALNASVYASEQQKAGDSTEASAESVKSTETTESQGAETASEPVSEKNTETTSESQGSNDISTNPGSQNNNENEANSESIDNNASTPDTESQDSVEAVAESEKNSEAASEAGSEKNSEANSEADSKKNSEANSEADSEKNSEANSEADSEKNSETASEAESEKSTEPTTETESEENTETETESENETESGTESENTETQTETETADGLTEEDPDSSVPADVFKVILPTIPEDDTTFDYILDPQGLIELTDAKKYGGTDEVAFERDKTLYFKTSKSDDGRPVYDNNSNTLTVTNMSSREVKITVKATIAHSEGITMSESSTFGADDTSASIYLALTDGTNTIPITADAAVLNAVIDAPKDAYETVWDGEKNVYELTELAKQDDYDGFQTYSFWLTGACNANADWSHVEGQIPEVYVVWEVE